MWLALALQANALDCAEIAGMVDVNVPIEIVVQMIDDQGFVSPGTVDCVREEGLPVEVIAAVKRAPVAGGATDQRPLRHLPQVPAPPPPPEVEGLSTRRAAKFLLTSNAPGAEYYLARALEELGLIHAAERRYASAYGHRDAWSEAALVELATIAERTGDWEEVDAILQTLDVVPSGLRSRWYLLEGLKHARARQAVAARDRLMWVSEASSSYRTAQLAYGVVVSWGCIRKSVFRAFQEAAKGHDAIADLARLNTSRASGAMGRHNQAVELYDLVPRSSPYYARAQLEAAWADFLLGDDLSALARLSRSGAIPRRRALPAAFEPEAPVLAALILGDHCEYAAARHVLDDFDAWADAPGELRRPNGSWSLVSRHLADLDAERARLRGPLRKLAGELDEERTRLHERLTESARSEQAWADAKLAEQVDQARIVREELARSEKAGERLLSSAKCRLAIDGL